MQFFSQYSYNSKNILMAHNKISLKRTHALELHNQVNSLTGKFINKIEITYREYDKRKEIIIVLYIKQCFPLVLLNIRHLNSCGTDVMPFNRSRLGNGFPSENTHHVNKFFGLTSHYYKAYFASSAIIVVRNEMYNTVPKFCNFRRFKTIRAYFAFFELMKISKNKLNYRIPHIKCCWKPLPFRLIN
uniref:Uncharacterized protein n=1 Tax=Heterorhabditis bacteriophora TaxID=37862 RepID=A0A1I7WAD9_HETBA